MSGKTGVTRVIGLGNRRRRDDGIGPAVAEALRRLALEDVAVEIREGDPLGLLDALRGLRRLILIDAVAGRGGPCRVHRFDAAGAPLNIASPTSSHALGLGETLELAKILLRLPRETIVYAVEGRDFGHGRGLSPEAESAAATCLRRVIQDLRASEWRRPFNAIQTDTGTGS